eukprot:134240-Pelagomonas_calceolata.AAC.1
MQNHSFKPCRTPTANLRLLPSGTVVVRMIPEERHQGTKGQPKRGIIPLDQVPSAAGNYGNRTRGLLDLCYDVGSYDNSRCRMPLGEFVMIIKFCTEKATRRTIEVAGRLRSGVVL